jgi:hypothetical protein
MAHEKRSFYLVTPGESDARGLLTPEGVEQVNRVVLRFKVKMIGQNVLVMSGVSTADMQSAGRIATGLELHRPIVPSYRIDAGNQEPRGIRRLGGWFDKALEEQGVELDETQKLIVVSGRALMAVGHDINERCYKEYGEIVGYQSSGEIFKFIEGSEPPDKASGDNYQNRFYNADIEHRIEDDIQQDLNIQRGYPEDN